MTQKRFQEETPEKAIERFQTAKLVAVIRRLPSESINRVLQALVDGGLLVLEITMDAQDALQVIEYARNTFGSDVLIGAGTVKTTGQVTDAVHAGAQFLVGPHFDANLIENARALGRLFIPGVLTPTEIQTALKVGVNMVKIFPARAMGPAYIKDLLGPFQDLKIMVTGGIEEETAKNYLHAGAVAVGMGSALFPKLDVENQNWSAISDKVKRILAKLQ